MRRLTPPGSPALYVLCAQGHERARATRAGSRSRRRCWPTVSALGPGSRVIGVYEQRWSAPVGPLAVALWGVGDPGNVGTVIRAAQAFGASCVALGPGCADPYGAEGGARVDGGDLRGRSSRASRALEELPGRVVALVAAGARAAARPAARAS